MVHAYVLIVVEPGEETNVESKLKEMDRITSTSVVYGEYDIVSEVKEESMESLQQFLIKEVRGLDEVERSKTMITLE